MNSSLHLIIGPMFSGKTSKLIEIAKNAKNTQKKYIALNFLNDKRYSTNKIVTHDGLELECIMVKNLFEAENLEVFKEAEIILINEGQFFTDLKNFCLKYLQDKYNKTIVVCGLNGDFKMRKFGEILDIIPFCETIQHLFTKCMKCKDGTPASFTKRIIDNEDKIIIGSNEYYIPVCRNCHKSI